MAIQVATAPVRNTVANTRRQTRSPEIKYAQKYAPFRLMHNWHHPVLPGETMKDIKISYDITQKGVKSDVVGWWLNHYLFYVPIRCLPSFDSAYEQMFTDHEAVAGNLTTQWSAAHPLSRFLGGGKYQVEIHRAVVNAFFRTRDEAETTDSGYYNIKYNHKSIMDSFFVGALPDYDFNVDMNADGTLMASELEQAQVRWQQAERMGLTRLDFDEWLAQYGIGTRQEIIPEPEILRFSRAWSMPTRIVDPATGDPVNYFRWSGTLSSGTRKYFREPGFLFHCSAVVPQMYPANLYPAAGMFITGQDWNPPEVWDKPFASYQHWAGAVGGRGPFKAESLDYNVDTRDCLVHGDTFLNYAESDVPTFTIDPSNKDYVDATDIAKLFVGDTLVEALGTGNARPSILGHVKDLTQTTVGDAITPSSDSQSSS